MASRIIGFIVVIAASMAPALAASGQSKSLPAFEVATVKPVQLGTRYNLGLKVLPGGRIEFGGGLTSLIHYAFDIQRFQVSGGPGWVASDAYTLLAVPPDSSKSRGEQQASVRYTPSEEQREMLQSLLVERFSLRYHWETRDGPIYILSRGKKPLTLEEPKDKERAPSCAVFVRGDIADGEVRCANGSMDTLARSLSENLELPVINRTELTGSYDLHVLPFDPDNREITTAMYGAMDRLGLKLERSRGPVKTLVIDSVTRPTAN